MSGSSGVLGRSTEMERDIEMDLETGRAQQHSRSEGRADCSQALDKPTSSMGNTECGNQRQSSGDRSIRKGEIEREGIESTSQETGGDANVNADEVQLEIHEDTPKSCR